MRISKTVVALAAVMVSAQAAAFWGWSVEPVPAPPGAAELGGTLALSGAGGGLSLATYDAVAGDLVLASRGTEGWQSARFAGRAGDADAGDAGLPATLTRDLGGALIVVWRDRGRNAVRVARTSLTPLGPDWRITLVPEAAQWWDPEASHV